jgi:hypothetical protein
MNRETRRLCRAGAALAIWSALSAANAGGTATVICRPTGSTYDDGTPITAPALQVNYSTGADAGTPGLFWFGILSPDQKRGAVLTPQGWQTYTGGLYPFQARYDAGFTPTIAFAVPFPDGSTNTGAYVGYSVYAGDGVYTTDMRQKVADRRASLNAVKPDMVAKGRWRPEFDSDDTYVWSLIQRDMTDNSKYGSIGSIPFVDCSPPNAGYNR